MFYSVQELSRILKLSDSSILRLIHEGELRAVKLGPRLYRIHETALEKLKESGLFIGENHGTN